MQFMNKSTKKAWIWGICTLIFTGIIFSFSLQPASQSSGLSGGLLSRILQGFYTVTGWQIPTETVHHLFRKCAHFTEFFVLGIFAVHFTKAIRRSSLWAVGYGMLVAVLDECLQFLTGEGRAMQFSDMILDTFGVVCAVVIFAWIWQCFRNRKEHMAS